MLWFAWNGEFELEKRYVPTLVMILLDQIQKLYWWFWSCPLRKKNSRWWVRCSTVSQRKQNAVSGWTEAMVSFQLITKKTRALYPLHEKNIFLMISDEWFFPSWAVWNQTLNSLNRTWPTHLMRCEASDDAFCEDLIDDPPNLCSQWWMTDAQRSTIGQNLVQDCPSILLYYLILCKTLLCVLPSSILEPKLKHIWNCKVSPKNLETIEYNYNLNASIYLIISYNINICASRFLPSDLAMSAAQLPSPDGGTEKKTQIARTLKAHSMRFIIMF